MADSATHPSTQAADTAPESRPDVPQPLPRHDCPVCGGPNGCAPAAQGSFEVACWCREVTVSPEALARVPMAQRGQSCLCARCATAFAASDRQMRRP